MKQIEHGENDPGGLLESELNVSFTGTESELNVSFTGSLKCDGRSRVVLRKAMQVHDTKETEHRQKENQRARQKTT